MEQPRGPPSRGGGAREDAGEAGLGERRRRRAPGGRRAAAAEAAEEGVLLLQHPALPGVRVRPDAGPGHGGSLPGEWRTGPQPPGVTCRAGAAGLGRRPLPGGGRGAGDALAQVEVSPWPGQLGGQPPHPPWVGLTPARCFRA